MFHLFYLYKASTMLMLSNRNATMINETQEFQHPRNRLLYDILVDTTIKMHKSVDFICLVIKILHYVKTLPQDMLERSSPMPIEIKQLIIDSAIKIYGCVDRISSKEYKEDDSDHYKTLVKLCFDIREYDVGIVILSTQKEFSEYKLEDYAINLATSHIALSQARYSYEFITSLRDQDKWTEDDAKHFEKITKCSNSYAKVAADTLHNYFEYYDYDLDALSETEFNFEILLEQLQLIEECAKKDRSVLFICYSTTEILHYVEKKMGKPARNGETYKSCLEAINDSDLGSFFEKWKEVDSSKIPITREFCRDMTKYEMLISCKRPIVDEETLKEWQKSIENISCRIADIFGYLESHWFKIAENDENKEGANDATPSTS